MEYSTCLGLGEIFQRWKLGTILVKYNANKSQLKICSIFFFLRAQQTLSIKVQIVNILGFAGHVVFIATMQLLHCSAEEAIDNSQRNTSVVVLQ